MASLLSWLVGVASAGESVPLYMLSALINVCVCLSQVVCRSGKGRTKAHATVPLSRARPVAASEPPEKAALRSQLRM